MTEKIPCLGCAAMILPYTAKKNDGLCMPCKNGYRDSIEKSKEHYKNERELDATCPYRALWRNLVTVVYQSDNGFNGLTDDEKIYFAVGILDGEVYNGGLVQYFDNSSGEYYKYSELGLIRIGAKETLKLLRAAKLLVFGNTPVPKEQDKRRSHVNVVAGELDEIDSEYYALEEDIGELLEAFAIKTGLVKNA